MTMNESALLSVSNLSIRLGQRGATLVDQVSLTLQRGEIFALVGESGSGKSLTSLAIMRLLPEALQQHYGSILLEHTNLSELPESAMNRIRGARIAMIFQEPQTSLNPVQTIGKQLEEVVQLHHPVPSAERQARLIELLHEVGIPDPEQRLHWYPHQLSGGQKQRVMIAMALACKPQLLIADEPTTALDVTIQRQILTLLKQLRDRHGLSILLITHDMGVVAEMADTVAVMQHGRIVERAPTRTFFTQPQHAYSRHLIQSLPKRHDFLAAETHAPLLSVRDLHVWFAEKKGLLQRTVGHTRAVEGISFDIGRGETLALVGESGCGKTTTGKAILRLEALHAGQVVFDGVDLSTLSRHAFHPYRRAIQVIFQDPFSSMNPRMSVREILEEGMLALNVMPDTKQRQQRIADLITRVGLDIEHLDRYPHEFSGGQRQRIAIARALAVDPQLIICDEPTSALDVSIRAQVLSLLRDIQQEWGVSYLFITHDLSIIPHLAHRVAVMKDGRIVEQANTKALLLNPQHPYTQSLLAAAPPFIELS